MDDSAREARDREAKIRYYVATMPPDQQRQATIFFERIAQELKDVSVASDLISSGHIELRDKVRRIQVDGRRRDSDLDSSLISETPTRESSSSSSDARGPSATLQLRAVRESLKEAAERFKVTIEAFESLEMEVAHLHRDKTNLEGEMDKLHLHNNSLEGMKDVDKNKTPAGVLVRSDSKLER